MKKIIGIVLILSGLLLIAQGINFIDATDRNNNTVIGRISSEVDSNYRESSSEQKTIGIVMLIAGGILIIIGLKKIFESDSSNNNVKNNLKNETTLDFLFLKLHSSVKQKDYKTGIAILKKIISIDPTSKEAYFNLACLYSLTENKESLYALSKAVENGYTNFDKIKTYPDLDWVRRNTRFNDFINHGYKIITTDHSKKSEQNSILISEETVLQIERLGKLKQQGLLTEDEFLEQKRRLLNANN